MLAEGCAGAVVAGERPSSHLLPIERHRVKARARVMRTVSAALKVAPQRTPHVARQALLLLPVPCLRRERSSRSAAGIRVAYARQEGEGAAIFMLVVLRAWCRAVFRLAPAPQS